MPTVQVVSVSESINGKNPTLDEKNALEGLIYLDPQFDNLCLTLDKETPVIEENSSLTPDPLPVLPDSPVKRSVFIKRSGDECVLPESAKKVRKVESAVKTKHFDWNTDADEELLRLVAKYKPISGHVWQDVQAEFTWAREKSLTTKQLFSRYHIIHPDFKHGKWEESHDDSLIQCLLYYKDEFLNSQRWPWSDIGKYVGRSPAQCKNRYNSARRSVMSTKISNRKKNKLYLWMNTQPWILLKK